MSYTAERQAKAAMRSGQYLRDYAEPHWFNEPEPCDEPDIPADDEWKKLNPSQLRALRDHAQRIARDNLTRHAPTQKPEEQS